MTLGYTMMRALAIKRVHSSLVATAGVTALLLGPSQGMAQSLGSAQSFALVGGSSVSAAGTGSVITGDVGVSPGISITGFPASATVAPPFNTHVNDGAAIAAQTSVTALYSFLASAGPCSPLGMQLNGVTVGPGTYCFSATADLAATGTLTLDGAGTYIFQVGSSLTANVLSTVLLIHGADPCNVFWQVTAAATLNGTGFAGNVVAQAGVDLGAGTMMVPVNLNGRALTTAAGAVTLAGFDTVGGCSAVATPTSTETLTVTPTATNTLTATNTPIPAPATMTETATATSTATQTPSSAATATPTAPSAATNTPTATPTHTQTLVSGTISGIVFDDANGTSAQDSGEQGLGGITVELINVSTGAVIRTTTTAADGTYVFSSVPPGSYLVRETDRSGYVSSTANIVLVTLPSGGLAAANFGDQQLGSLFGASYDDLDHNGVQDSGEPGLAGSIITLINPSTGAVVRTATTGGDGSYLIGGVPVGTYTVQETDPAAYASSTSNAVQVTISGTSPASVAFGNFIPAPTPTRTPTLTPTPTRTPTTPPSATSTRAPTWTPTRTQAPPPDLVLGKRHSGSFRTGQAGTYILTATNVGSGPTLGPITLTDTLPVGFTYASASGTGWSCSGVAAVSCVNNSILSAGAFTAIALKVNVSTSAAALSLNTATVATAGDPNVANNAASDPTNVMGGTSDALNTPAARTPTSTSTAGLQPTPTPTPTPTPIIPPAPRPSTPAATPTARTRPARMGVRLVAVARVPANSIMYYTVAVLLIGKGTIPDVRATLTLPPEVQFLSTDLPATTTPQVGSSGVLTWQLGDTSSYPNRPFHVAALVRADLELGRQFWGELTVTNGTGFITTKRRKSYVGNGNLH